MTGYFLCRPVANAPAVEGVGRDHRSLSRLDLHELGGQFEAFGRRATRNRLALGFDAKAGTALPGGGNPI